jgi:hypothetical protein
VSIVTADSTLSTPVQFADPYKVCNECGGWVTGAVMLSTAQPGRSGGGKLVVLPCEHERGYEDVCPSWSPVDGCQCEEHLGHVPHAQPTPR